MGERTKLLKVNFLSERYTLIANFSVEKVRLRRSLVEHAAEVVAKMEFDPEDLEIPETLKPLVRDKIIDANWVASHQDIKLEGVPEDYDKTVYQVVPVSRSSMMKSFFQTFLLKPLRHLFCFSP